MPPAQHSRQVFAQALLSPAAPVPGGLAGSGGAGSARRFGVYRNNVVAGLIDALEDTFPAVRRIVGDEFFSAMARVYAMANPPPTQVLLNYGETFPAFLQTFAPAQELPYLPDVAAIEFAWLKAYHAREQRPLDRRAFLAVREASAPQLRLVLHPSAAVVRSVFPATTIWHANREQEVIEEIRLDRGGEDALIVRPVAEVGVHLLRPGNAAFLRALGARRTLADATRVAAAGLLAMTCVIQLVAPDGWANFHLYWAAISTTLIALGPGLLSLDGIIAARIKHRNGVTI